MKKFIRNLIALITAAVAGMFAFNLYTEKKVDKLLDKEEKPDGLTFSWANGNIYYEKHGSGEPILLIHDLNPVASGLEWKKVAQILSESRTVYAVDLPGCGRSEKPKTTYVNYLYVQFVNDFIKNVIGARTDIACTGESFAFVIMASRLKPENFGHIFTVNPESLESLSMQPEKKDSALKNVLETPLLGTFIYNVMSNKKNIDNIVSKDYYFNETKPSKELLEEYYLNAHRQKTDGKYLYSSILSYYTNIDISNALKAIENSITLIVSDAYSNAKEYMAIRDDLEIIELEDAGYLPQLEYPKTVAKILI